MTGAVAPILLGLDKFAGILTDGWTRYLATQFNDIIPGSAQDAMHLVGVVEVIAGLVVTPCTLLVWSRSSLGSS